MNPPGRDILNCGRNTINIQHQYLESKLMTSCKQQLATKAVDHFRREEDVIDDEGIGPDSATAVSHIASGTQKSLS